MPALRSLAALAVVLAMQAGDSSCEPSTKACQIDTRGIRVEDGVVTDVITATCNPPPRTHRLDGWIEYRADVGEPWRILGRKRTERVVPDAEGFPMRVQGGRCVPGVYRTAWQATGVGPNDERPFNFSDGDVFSTTLDCEE